MSDDVSDEPMDAAPAEDELDDDFDDGDEAEGLTDDASVSGDKGDDEDDEEDEAGVSPAVAAGDDEDEPDPDEVEADLGEILRDRIAANEDDEEENVPAPVPTGELVERQDTELHCPHCFLLIQAKTVAETGECGHCGGPIS